jgi:hypothetical protein
MTLRDRQHLAKILDLFLHHVIIIVTDFYNGKESAFSINEVSQSHLLLGSENDNTELFMRLDIFPQRFVEFVWPKDQILYKLLIDYKANVDET